MNLVKWVVGPRACGEIRQEFHAHREECRAALITRGQVPAAVSCLLWDPEAERIISFAEYERTAVAQRA